MLCPRVGSCEVGGPLQQDMRCAPGHTGAGCAACESGWVPQDGSPCAPCVQCDTHSFLSYVAFLCTAGSVVLGLVFLAYSAVSKRGQVVQDLLFGSLRVLSMYVSMLSYVFTAFAPPTEDSLGLESRSVRLEQWQEACGRQLVTHKAAVQSVSLNATWQSDLQAYQTPRSDRLGSYMDQIIDTVSGLSGAVPNSSVQMAG